MLLVFYSMRCPALLLGLVADQHRPTIHGGAGRDRFPHLVAELDAGMQRRVGLGRLGPPEGPIHANETGIVATGVTVRTRPPADRGEEMP
jgi:hypothetical protein